MRPAIKSDGGTYYEYVLLYTDDALVIGEKAEDTPLSSNKYVLLYCDDYGCLAV